MLNTDTTTSLGRGFAPIGVLEWWNNGFREIGMMRLKKKESKSTSVQY
jgi:hypothetical protein